jgi:ABC-2 type transport system ATP-binding protein
MLKEGVIPLIEVKGLTKRYGDNLAVDHIDFTIEKGHIYGLLGPNGAGKSTTMNIITGYIGATDGEVTINGVSILDEPEKAKSQIGYLPEIPPLYTDMTPYEYLCFAAELKKIPASKRKEAVSTAMEKTGIVNVQNRLISNLSKGYRQRVGLAQAILSMPEIIILDEPTVGLDPSQIIEIRDLIRELSHEHTVILSSHILSEVQEVCDRIMIISHGKLVASGTPQELEETLGSHEISVTIKNEYVAEAETLMVQLTGVQNVSTEITSNGEATLTMTIQSGLDLRETVFTTFVKAGIPLLALKPSEFSLEQVFLRLTAEAEQPEILEEQESVSEETHEEAQTEEATSDESNI